jgi:hypothetical protein
MAKLTLAMPAVGGGPSAWVKHDDRSRPDENHDPVGWQQRLEATS